MNKPIREFGQENSDGERQSSSLPSLERRRLRAYIALLFSDSLAIYVGFALAGLLYHGVLLEWRAMMQAYLIVPIYYTIALYSRTYSARVLTDWRFAVRKSIVAILISAALLNFVAFYLKSNAEFSRVTFTLGIVLTILLIGFVRLLTSSMVDRFWQGKVQNHLVLDDGGPSFAMPGATVISTHSLELDPGQQDLPMLTRLGQLLHNQDKVVVTCPPERSNAWAHMLKSIGVHGEIISQHAHELGAIDVVRYDDWAQTTLVVSSGPLRMRERVLKRGFDLIIAIGGLILSAPLLLVAAIAIKLEDGGKVFFVQQRLGRGNRFFSMFKFRTMKEESSDQEGAISTCRDDHRVTRIGRILRATSVDEMPQLWNVLRGEMSIVGPRPHAAGSRANEKLFWEIDGLYWRRHALKPGLTGLAQVRGHRGATDSEQHLTDRLSSDLEYINGWSLGRDIMIVARTLAVIWHDRAY